MDVLKYLLHNLWWPFVGGAAVVGICVGIASLANRRQR